MGLFSSLDSAASSLVSGIFGTVNSSLDRKAQNANIDKQIEAQAAENQKTREYNLNLAKMENQWNLEQWNRENEYNTPLQQRQRLAEAGLNPDLMYQNGTSGLTAASSPTMTSGVPATPQDFSALGQKKTVGQAMQEGLQSSMLGAQLDLMRAQTRKTEAEAHTSEINNDTLGAMNESELQQYRDNHDLNKQQFENLKETNSLIKEQVNLLSEQAKQAQLVTKNMPLQLRQENLQRNWEIIWKKRDVDRILAGLDLTKEQIWQIRKSVPAQVSLWENQASQTDLTMAIANFFNGLLGSDPENTPNQTLRELGEALREYLGLGSKPAPVEPPFESPKKQNDYWTRFGIR